MASTCADDGAKFITMKLLFHVCRPMLPLLIGEELEPVQRHREMHFSSKVLSGRWLDSAREIEWEGMF